MIPEYTYPNNYQTGLNYVPQEFFGREDDIEDLLSRVRNGQNICLIGQRRIGRTWLLDHLVALGYQNAEVTDSLLIPNRIDLTLLRHFPNPAEAAQKINTLIQTAMMKIGWIGNTKARFGLDSWDGFFDAFEFFAPILEHCGKKLVLLFDEAEALSGIYRTEGESTSKHSNLANKLVQLLESMPQYRLIMVTHVPLKYALKDLGTTLHTRLIDIPFGSIGLTATTALLRSRENSSSITYKQEAMSRVYLLSGGHPLFIRLLGQEIIDSGIKGDIEVEHIDTAFHTVLANTGRPHLETDYSQATNEVHQQILNKLAEDANRTSDELYKLMAKGLSVTDFKNHYWDLKKMGLLISDGEIGNEKPHFCNEFLKAYIQQLNGYKYQLPSE